jgi:hypothetical protein
MKSVDEREAPGEDLAGETQSASRTGSRAKLMRGLLLEARPEEPTGRPLAGGWAAGAWLAQPAASSEFEWGR